MLVLARKFNESIMIGDEIEVIIIEIKNDQVKLGIKAPKKIAVHRKEVYEEIQLENIAALSSEFKPEDLKRFSNFLKKNSKSDKDKK
ncbi:MAG: carbon storage regulator CsrA [Spirochaetota bacterium]